MKNKIEKKGFFRITKNKIVLSILLLIALLFVAYVYNSSFTFSGFELHSDAKYSALLGFIAWPFIVALVIGFQTQINIGLLLVGAIVLQVLYTYLIACILVWIFDKLKKNN